jgi:hypothetical protein
MTGGIRAYSSPLFEGKVVSKLILRQFWCSSPLSLKSDSSEHSSSLVNLRQSTRLWDELPGSHKSDLKTRKCRLSALVQQVTKIVYPHNLEDLSTLHHDLEGSCFSDRLSWWTRVGLRQQGEEVFETWVRFFGHAYVNLDVTWKA